MRSFDLGNIGVLRKSWGNIFNDCIFEISGFHWSKRNVECPIYLILISNSAQARCEQNSVSSHLCSHHTWWICRWMCTVTGLQKMLTLKKLTWQTQGNQEKLKLQESKKANVNNGIVLHLKIVFLTFPGDFYTPIFFPIWVIHNCSIFWDLRNLQELLPEIVLNFHCLNKLFKWSQKIWKISDFDLKFQKFFSITRTFFFLCRSKIFWEQNNISWRRQKWCWLCQEDHNILGLCICCY